MSTSEPAPISAIPAAATGWKPTLGTVAWATIDPTAARAAKTAVPAPNSSAE